MLIPENIFLKLIFFDHFSERKKNHFKEYVNFTRSMKPVVVIIGKGDFEKKNLQDITENIPPHQSN